MKSNLTMPRTIESNLQLLEMEYMPLTQMIEIMEKKESLPYKTWFSFEPYLNVISNKMVSACPNTKGALYPVLEGSSKYIEGGDADLDMMFENEHFQTLVSLVVPSMFFKDDRGFICPPFQKKILVATPAFEEMLDASIWEIKIQPEKFLEDKNESLTKVGFHLLNQFYGQNLSLKQNNSITLRNKRTMIERHYQMDFKLDFVETIKLKPLPKLDQKTINKLIANPGDEELWLKHLPADHFEFKGFATGNFYDVSEIEILSRLKQWMNDNNSDI